MVICLQRGADCLHMVQLMPLPLPKPHRLFRHLNPDWFYSPGNNNDDNLHPVSHLSGLLYCVNKTSFSFSLM